MCNVSLSDFLPLTVNVGEGGIPTVGAIRRGLMSRRFAASGLSEEAWRRVGVALAGATSKPESLISGSQIVISESRGDSHLPRSQRPLAYRLITPALVA